MSNPTLPVFWRQNVVGSDDGDGVVPLEYQQIYRNNHPEDSLLGGDSHKRYEQYVGKAFHTGHDAITYLPDAKAGVRFMQTILFFESALNCDVLLQNFGNQISNR